MQKSSDSLADSIQIVLVETSHPGNIGSVARAMKTMGLRRLTLVAPIKPIDDDAIAKASRADDILDNARIVDTLPEALAQSRHVYGMTARIRRIGVPEQPLREAAPAMVANAALGEISVVFGRERSGLTNAELDLCHGRVFIPSNPEYGSLNLAAAVQVVAYELYQHLGRPAQASDMTPPAPHEDVERFYVHLEQVLEKLDFLNKNNAEVLMRRLRRLYQRAMPDENEINILRGILSETEKRVD